MTRVRRQAEAALGKAPVAEDPDDPHAVETTTPPPPLSKVRETSSNRDLYKLLVKRLASQVVGGGGHHWAKKERKEREGGKNSLSVLFAARGDGGDTVGPLQADRHRAHPRRKGHPRVRHRGQLGRARSFCDGRVRGRCCRRRRTDGQRRPG